MEGENRTLGGDVMLGIEKDNVQLQWQGGPDIVTDRLGEVHGAQSLWNLVGLWMTTDGNQTYLYVDGIT